jgi:hypothetical protein
MKSQKGKQLNVRNILAGLLCAFQILEVGAGTHFNVDEKDFFNALYTILNIMFSSVNLKDWQEDDRKDFMALLKCLDLVFCKKKQLSH